MANKKKSAHPIDAYVAKFPKETQKALKLMRRTIRAAAPKATETINYGIPTFKLEGNLVHFGAYKTHIGFYPGSAGIEEFKEQLTSYRWAKGSVQFPLEQPLPTALITRIVKFRVKQNLTRKKLK